MDIANRENILVYSLFENKISGHRARILSVTVPDKSHRD
jgi:hypothetical protein